MSAPTLTRAQEALALFSRIEASGAFSEPTNAVRKTEGKTSARDGPGRTQTPGRPTKKQEEVDDAIMKRLHKRNKELQREVEELTNRLALHGANGLSSAPNLQATVVKPDMHANKQRSTQLAVAQAEVSVLQRQLNEHRASNLRSIDVGEATGKVNKDVKAFFQATRQKILEDAAQLEAERAIWNQALVECEEQLGC